MTTVGVKTVKGYTLSTVGNNLRKSQKEKNFRLAL